MSDTNLVKLGGLWTNPKDGNVFFSGYMGMARLLIFKNGFKIAGSNEPDYIMYVTTNKPKPETDPQEPTEEPTK